MTLNRRQFVIGAGATAGLAGLGTVVLADDDVSVEIAGVFPVADVVVLENTGDESVNLDGYVLDWEHANSDYDQTDEIGAVTIEPGEQLSVWSGFQSTQIPPVEADHQLGEYGNGRINASESDLIALLSPDGDVVDETDYDVDGQSYEDYLGERDEPNEDGGNDSDEDGDDESDEDSEPNEGGDGSVGDEDDGEDGDADADDGEDDVKEGGEDDTTEDAEPKPEEDDC